MNEKMMLSLMMAKSYIEKHTAIPPKMAVAVSTCIYINGLRQKNTKMILLRLENGICHFFVKSVKKQKLVLLFAGVVFPYQILTYYRRLVDVTFTHLK